MFIVRIKALLSCQKASLILVLVGLACLGITIFLKLYFIKPSVTSSPQPKGQPQEYFFPVQILIPKVKIDLSVSSAKAEGENWEISEKGVSYLLGSGIPGQKGNVVIFGHNKNSLFGPIRWLEKDDEIRIINRKNEEFVYRVIEIKKVSPKQVDILAPTEESILTIYTCSGFLDKERLTLKAKLQLPQK